MWSCRAQHTAQDVLAFFKVIDASVELDLDIHVVLDNLSAQMAPPVADWLAHPNRARWHLHLTLSWLNLVERWLKELTRRLRRGTFTSVGTLIDGIHDWAEHWNTDPKPYMWHKTAEEIIPKYDEDAPPSPKSNPRRSTRVVCCFVKPRARQTVSV